MQTTSSTIWPTRPRVSSMTFAARRVYSSRRRAIADARSLQTMFLVVYSLFFFIYFFSFFVSQEEFDATRVRVANPFGNVNSRAPIFYSCNLDCLIYPRLLLVTYRIFAYPSYSCPAWSLSRQAAQYAFLVSRWSCTDEPARNGGYGRSDGIL